MNAIASLVLHLLIILMAGLVSGVICRRLGVSMLVGYLVIGALIGGGGLGLLTDESRELEYIARAGALLLLFSIGIEFSPGDIAHLGRYFSIGGSVQMLLVALPVTAAWIVFGGDPRTAVLIGAATALSSTVLVFKSLEEWGYFGTPLGRRAIGILLFQDVAMVPLMLLVPMLTGSSGAPGPSAWLLLAAKSVLFVLGVLTVRLVVRRWGVRLLSQLGSVELVVLSALIVLVGACLAAFAIGLPPALGALAAGIVLSGNRLSGQFDALMLPFRETFTAVFFVSLGTLMRFQVLADAPVAAFAGLAGVLALKTGAAACALRLVGLRWQPALGMGLGLAQMGEFSFVLLSEAASVSPPVVDADTYSYMLFLALGSLILTPQLLKLGLTWAGKSSVAGGPTAWKWRSNMEPIQQAVVIGSGPIGGRVATHLETTGMDVCLVDLKPLNLHPFAQQGFRTVAGDAGAPEILRHAGIENCALAVITVPDDEVAVRIAGVVRRLNRACAVLVRCRYQSHRSALERAGVWAVVSEEAEVGGAILRLLEQLPVLAGPDGGND